MANRYWTYVTQLVSGTLAKAGDVNASLSGASTGFDDVETEMDTKLGFTNPDSKSVIITDNATARSNKLIGFDSTGNVDVVAASEAGLNSTYTDNSNGNPNISDDELLITTALTIDTWETIGPSAAAADNTWIALDSVPAGVNWIEVRGRIIGTWSGSDIGASLYARKTGGSEARDKSNRVYGFNDSLIGTGVSSRDQLESGIKIPVDSSVQFDAFWRDHASTPSALVISLWLTGYGYNT